MHGVNGHARIPATEPHVPHDDDRWQLAISLALDLESVSTTVLRKVFAADSVVFSQDDILRQIMAKSLLYLANLESYLPLDDLDRINDMFELPKHKKDSSEGSQRMLASVKINDDDRKDSKKEFTLENREKSCDNIFNVVFPWYNAHQAPSSPLGRQRIDDLQTRYVCHWKSSFIVGSREKVSLITPLTRFLAKAFVYAAEAGISAQSICDYLVCESDGMPCLSLSRQSSASSRERNSSTNLNTSSPAPSPCASEDGSQGSEVPFEFGMKCGLNEMYHAMSNATADMSASGSESMSKMRDRLSHIRSTISDLSEMVQTVNVVDQYGGIGDPCDDMNDISVTSLFDKMRGICMMCEYAIRSLSFASQVNRGMWRRNGNSVANLIYNYSRPVLSRNFRDLDIAALQLGVLWIGPRIVLRNMITIFEVSQVLPYVEVVKDEDKNKPEKGSHHTESGNAFKRKILRHQHYKSDVTIEHSCNLLADMLKTICHMVTYLPCDISVEKPIQKKFDMRDENSGDIMSEGLCLSLDRFIVHMILSGHRTLSKLGTAKHLVGKDDAVSDHMIEMAVRRVCSPYNKKLTGKDNKLVFDVNPAVAVAFFDPEFPFLSSSDLHTATEAMKSILDNRPYDDSILCENYPHAFGHFNAKGAHVIDSEPIIASSALPIPHPLFRPVRQVILGANCFEQFLCSALEFVMNPSCSVETPKKGSKSSTVSPVEPSILSELAARIVHLVTLRIHSDELPCSASSETESNWDPNLIFNLSRLQVESNHGVQSISQPQGLDWVLKKLWLLGDHTRYVMKEAGVDFAESDIVNHEKQSNAPDGDSKECSLSAKESELQARKLAAQKRAMAFIQKQVCNVVVF